MDEFLVYICEGCGVLKAVVAPPDIGIICVVCAGVNTQRRVAITIRERDKNEGEIAAIVKLLP